MATLLTSGTQLHKKLAAVPLNKRFLIAVGAAFLVAAHFFTPNPGGAGLMLSFNPPVWVAISVALGIAAYQTARNRVVRYSKLSIALLVSCILLTLPVFYPNAEPIFALPRLSGLWAGLALLFALQQFRFSNEEKQRLLWFILLAVLIEALLGWAQYTLFSQGNFMGYNTIRNRPYGIFQQPNVMASFLSTGLVLSGYLLARQPHTKYLHWRYKLVLLYATPILTIPLLIVLASRTGWLGALISLALLLPYVYRFAARNRSYLWLSMLGLGFIVGIGLTQIGSNQSLLQQKTDLESPRAYTFPQTLDMLIERPLSGYGYGQFETEYTVYTARQHQLNSDYPAGLPAMDHPHNELLYWGVEGGVVPLFGLLLAMGYVLYWLNKAKHGTRIGILALFVPIVLHTQLEYPFYHSAIHWISFIILIYWVDQRGGRAYLFKFGRSSKLALRVSSLLLPIFCSVFMISALQTNYVLTSFERSKPKDPNILDKVTNPVVWKDRYEWDINSTFLQLGLATRNPKYIQTFIDWAQEFVKHKPRPAIYKNLIIAYQGQSEEMLAEEVRGEAKFLFPKVDFDNISLVTVEQKTASATNQ
ncbi:PglL family O-oligosaccharyltransferase [Vibrio gallicus]|uniref:PglL family O-oligosaccharyltransferase n=1 Tax=Vibrio gallicus TaxID=190897 RepID=UPI0021C333D9|nr:PglL family O-oligosaccharyltransferase [Vibrio gallicus]